MKKSTTGIVTRSSSSPLRFHERHAHLQGARFCGVPQGWDAELAVPVAQDDQLDDNYYWVGDGGGLLRTVQYYGMSTGDDQRYATLENPLKQWLAARAHECETIIAEGNTNMYAALSAYASDTAIPLLATQLHRLCNNNMNTLDYGRLWIMEHGSSTPLWQLTPQTGK